MSESDSDNTASSSDGTGDLPSLGYPDNADAGASTDDSPDSSRHSDEDTGSSSEDSVVDVEERRTLWGKRRTKSGILLLPQSMTVTEGGGGGEGDAAVTTPPPRRSSRGFRRQEVERALAGMGVGMRRSASVHTGSTSPYTPSSLPASPLETRGRGEGGTFSGSGLRRSSSTVGASLNRTWSSSLILNPLSPHSPTGRSERSTSRSQSRGGSRGVSGSRGGGSGLPLPPRSPSMSPRQHFASSREASFCSTTTANNTLSSADEELIVASLLESYAELARWSVVPLAYSGSRWKPSDNGGGTKKTARFWAKGAVSIVTYNVMASTSYGGSIRVSALLQELKAARADVIALQQVTGDFLQSLASQSWVRKKYYITDVTGATLDPAHPTKGLVLLSVIPMKKVRVFELPGGMGSVPGTGSRALVAVLAHPYASFAVATFQGEPSALPWQLDYLYRRLDKYDVALLAADFQCADYSPEEVFADYADASTTIPVQARPDYPERTVQTCGATFDPRSNSMLSAKFPSLSSAERRPDRILLRSRKISPPSGDVRFRYVAAKIALVGVAPVQEYANLFPSCHYGVRVSLRLLTTREARDLAASREQLRTSLEAEPEEFTTSTASLSASTTSTTPLPSTPSSNAKCSVM